MSDFKLQEDFDCAVANSERRLHIVERTWDPTSPGSIAYPNTLCGVGPVWTAFQSTDIKWCRSCITIYYKRRG